MEPESVEKEVTCKIRMGLLMQMKNVVVVACSPSADTVHKPQCAKIRNRRNLVVLSKEESASLPLCTHCF